MHAEPTGSGGRFTVADCRKADDFERLCDKRLRRFRVMPTDFDSRCVALAPISDDWEENVKELHKINRARTLEGLAMQFGISEMERKSNDFVALGIKPFSIVAHHNILFEQVRHTFVLGSYYPALTGACALGERILNHLILDLREKFTKSPRYKEVHAKKSFDYWSKTISILEEWQILLPAAVSAFNKLWVARNRAIHFNLETIGSLREHSLNAIQILAEVINLQFGAFGLQPWYIPGVRGACFIRRDFETHPFIQTYFMQSIAPLGILAGYHSGPEGMLRPLDIKDYGDGELSDTEFAKAYNERNPAEVIQDPNDPRCAWMRQGLREAVQPYS